MRKLIIIGFLLLAFVCEGKLPDILPQDVAMKANEMMKAHASHKELTPSLVQRILINYLENLDVNKIYFIKSDIEEWTKPSEALLKKIIDDHNEGNYSTFEQIQERFISAIERRKKIEECIDFNDLPAAVRSEEFKDMPWVESENELATRLKKIRSLQLETASKLSPDIKEKSMLRIAKRRIKYEEDMCVADSQVRQRLILSQVLKAIASSLDSHSAYFTPGEASQFMIHVQQRLFGIGAQLRDDLNGLSVIKIIEGGPAALGKQLRLKDRIVTVNGEPVVGMDIADSVELIRGEANTPVILTVIRETKKPDGSILEEKLDITIMRGEVVLKESRFKSRHEPFGNHSIGYLKLYSFYQDQLSSSAEDLKNEIEKLKKEHNIKGLVLDLRYNSGGLLTQAAAVSGLFIKKGIVVSIKDENMRVQHLREMEETMAWEGPLIVLVNRLSASASEIVAQTLQDYGRAIIVGDDHTFGKGSFQTFTLSTDEPGSVNPQGEFKITRGRYYTPSGRTPQLLGVPSDIIVPGPLSESEIGEKFAKYPLENDTIKPNFKDDLSDIPFFKRDKIRKWVQFGLQEKQDIYNPFVEILKCNSHARLQNCNNYKNLMKEIQKKESLTVIENFGQNDLQLEETYHIMKDLIILLDEKKAA